MTARFFVGECSDTLDITGTHAYYDAGEKTPPGQIIRQDKKIHWCFIGERVPVPESIAHIPNVMRNQLNIRHPNGEAIFFDFFVGNDHSWNSVLPYMTAHLKIGYTIAIMYAVHTEGLNLLAESKEMITVNLDSLRKKSRTNHSAQLDLSLRTGTTSRTMPIH